MRPRTCKHWLVLHLAAPARRNLPPRPMWTLQRQPMKHSLRQTPSHLHLAYKYGEAADSLLGRHFTLDVQGRELTLAIDLTPNFHTRNKASASYLDAMNLTRNHHKLRFLQCSDNLVRSRLIKAWERVEQPRLRMCLDLGTRGHYVYLVLPHSLFMGGIQLDVLEVLEGADDTEESLARGQPPQREHHHLSHGNHA